MINVRIQPQEAPKLSPRITVIGVGGAGGNAVNNMISSGLEGVRFIACNTDAQALAGSMAESKIQLGPNVTAGLGAGSKPDVGKAAAEESLDDLMALLHDANMVFITAGMGGGTGTGAAPVIAEACRQRGILTVGVVTKPFHFEGTLRMKMAEEGIARIQGYVDTLIVIPNQNLFRVANERTTFAEAFRMADDVLLSGVRGITDLMIMEGLINLDFADVRSAMTEMGKAMMGTGEASGDKRALNAAESAINNPLLDDVSMKGARGVIINVTGGYDMTLFEVDEACNRIRDEVDPNANIIFGSTFNTGMEGTMRVTVLATGIEGAVQGAAKTTGGGYTLTDSRGAAARVGSVAPAVPLMPRPAPLATPPVTQRSAAAFEQIAMRGTRLNENFIPPVAADPVRMAPYGEADPVQNDPSAARLASLSVRDSAYVPQTAPSSGVSSVQWRSTGSADRVADQGEQAASAYGPAASMPEQGYADQRMERADERHAAPPVDQTYAPAHNTSTASVRSRPPSFFERLTGALWRYDDTPDANAQEKPSVVTREPRVRAPIMPSMPPTMPMQGRLDIDAPAKVGAPSADELDIPAFLRRQAN